MLTFSNDVIYINDNDYHYTKIENHILEANLSYKAIGIYTTIKKYQNAKNHSISLNWLAEKAKDGIASIRQGVKELVEAGFIVTEYKRNNKGHFLGVTYRVYAKPVENTCVKPICEKRISDNPTSENRIDINKNNNKRKIKDKIKYDDDVSVEDKVTTTEESSSIDKENVTIFLEAYSKAMEREFILKPSQEVAITNLINKFGMGAVLKAVKNIEGNPYLIERNDPDKFVLYFVNIFNNKYIHWKIKAAQPQKPIKKTRFNYMDSREWNFEELDRLEDEYIDRKLAKSQEKETESLNVGGIKLDTVSQVVGTETVEQVTFAGPEQEEQPDYSIDLTDFVMLSFEEICDLSFDDPEKYKEYTVKANEYDKRKRLGLI